MATERMPLHRCTNAAQSALRRSEAPPRHAAKAAQANQGCLVIIIFLIIMFINIAIAVYSW